MPIIPWQRVESEQVRPSGVNEAELCEYGVQTCQCDYVMAAPADAIVYAGIKLKRFPQFRVDGPVSLLDLSSNNILTCGLIPPTTAALNLQVGSRSLCFQMICTILMHVPGTEQ
jgi:hypothetical protein